MPANDENLTVADLKPAPDNPRVITDERLARLKTLMENLGDLSGITVNRRTGEMVTGHQRTRNLPRDARVEIVTRYDAPNPQGTVAVGWVVVPVPVIDAETGEQTGVTYERWGYREVDWDRERQVAANIAANNPHVQGEYDFPMLADQLTHLDAYGLHELTGFDALMIESMLTWTPMSRDENTEEHGEPRHDDLWPEVRLKLSHETKLRWDAVYQSLPGSDDDSRVQLLLDRVEDGGGDEE